MDNAFSDRVIWDAGESEDVDMLRAVELMLSVFLEEEEKSPPRGMVLRCLCKLKDDFVRRAAAFETGRNPKAPLPPNVEAARIARKIEILFIEESDGCWAGLAMDLILLKQ
mmetsp:Transcript_3440/g.8187  ORF Transcript_3440/g.8187 Transcript_3440/m.8187 type:complete len:111 (-) Transcript_3440:53-385(-)